MSDFDFSVILENWGFLAQGLRYTVQVTITAMLGGILIGTVLALMRLSSLPPLQWFAAGYVNIFRSVPLVQVILAFYLILPMVLQMITGKQMPIGAANSAYFTFTVFEAAYYSEIMRSGIQSVPRGQVAAGYAMGFTYGQTMRLVVLPQAFRNMLPVLLTQTIILFQDVSLVYAIGATDFFGAADKITQRDLRPVEMYTTVAVVYFVICFTLSRLVKLLQSRIAIIR
ncbi:MULTISPECIES: amino acid ABC transporter permease [Aromatoleum]|uniref:ABC transporter permease subunit n=2 Tax=Aromatoleum TaxID=551759 RepID=A0ABX1NRH8_9RHOO|nr:MULTISPECIES: amino acid ABC transporter permease [Aromatoleum]MCK0509043.1 amino acid ABC transporter permease [Aromatoleum anaerobium]NMG14498.1 ABC transporter permease subunit [Aromatoleum bremense]QTQ30834.1 Glutamate/aspartate transport system permease protein [Aromatoleum bremense]